jgi:uncharacterized protein YjeT (DUF2065 family)
MKIKKIFLIVAFSLVTVIALLYGISPQWFGRIFLGIEQLDHNIAHILRAIMGLYVALGLFWLYSAFHAPFRNIAVLTTAIFAGGLVTGRLISLLTEGPPAPLLIFYIAAELSLAPLAYWIYRQDD